jgi:exopolyphosphatase/guanosine-5'-triphosphate,3'-diphosphate pyrophosphatase
MRYAILDLGTNIFNLLVLENLRDGYKVLYETKEPVKLGKGGMEHFSPQAQQRAIGAVGYLFRKCWGYGTDHILALGTSAFRRASNAPSLVHVLFEQFGIAVEIITGDLEAELIYKGVRQAVDLNNHTALILDIGGGSNELILCNKKTVLWKKSYELGMARLLERFHPSDPPGMGETKNIVHYLEHEMNDLFTEAEYHKPNLLVGAAGSFDTFVHLLNAQAGRKKSSLLPSTGMPYHEYLALHEQLIQSNQEERLAMRGMEPFRADMIGLASLLVDLILTKTGIRQLMQSSYALKEGAVDHFLQGRIVG